MTFVAEPGDNNSINVIGSDQVLKITASGLGGLLGRLPFVGANPFYVKTKRFDPDAHVISVVSLMGHPLAGWRYFRVYSIGTDDVVIETGAYDQPGPGWSRSAGYYISKATVSKGWEEYMQYFQQKYPVAQGSHLSTALGTIPLRKYAWPDGSLLKGYWDYNGDFTSYILNNACPTTVCN